jgi:membrane-bound lytic murein transglycosylase D
MNKLLLLATSLFCFTLQGYSAGMPTQGGASILRFSINDSSLKEATKTADPKDGFRDLFDNSSKSDEHSFKLNPKAVSFVEDYMESDGERLAKMKAWGKPYFDKMNDIFTQYHLPVELKYLAVIESDLKTSATSRVGAAGPWQFMAETARGLGLRVNHKVDERRDFLKSTKAAARYLSSLYKEYNDWLLVIAAYNCGGGVVNSAIRRSGSHNFWELQNYLPAESRIHVKKFIATHYIMEGDGGLTTLTKKETEALADVDKENTTIVKISGKYTSEAIAFILQMNQAEFNRLNPELDREISAKGIYDLRLPHDKVAVFQANKPEILDLSVRMMITATR